MDKISAREKLEIAQQKGSLTEHIIILISGSFSLFIIFPVFFYVVFTGHSSDVVWFGFIDGFVFFMILSFIGGVAGLYFGIERIKKYKIMKKEEKKIY